MDVTPEAGMTDPKRLYDEDFALWSKQQADALRAAANGGSNREIDWEHLAEEIEDLGISQRHYVQSHIMRIIQHLAKLEYSPAVEPRNGWSRTVRLARLQIQRRLEDNPSLWHDLGHFVSRETKPGIELAIIDLEEDGEIDELGARTLRRAHYSQEQVLSDWFPEEPKP